MRRSPADSTNRSLAAFESCNTSRVKDLAGVWLAHALASRQGWSTNTSEWSSNLN